MKTVTVAAFGALNQESYEMFSEYLEGAAAKSGVTFKLVCASPYPNKSGTSEPGRPLRAEALESEEKKADLLKAVADDARQIGAETADICVMPCMSMIGFHDGIEKALGKKIFKLSDALANKYQAIDKVGVIHMRPAKKRIEEIFGAKAITPDDAQATRLLAAEEEAKKLKRPTPVEQVMEEITKSWRDKGVKHVLFARADAPKARKSAAGMVAGVRINSYFDILADSVVQSVQTPKPAAPAP